MKLLPPREREALKQKEQERLVVEETARQKRIDGLREAEESSKKRLADYQEKEFERHRIEVEKRQNELSGLDMQIAEKKKEWKSLLEPLDKQFARFVRDERKKIEGEHAANEAIRAELEREKEVLGSKKDELEADRKQVAQERVEVTLVRSSFDKKKLSDERDIRQQLKEASDKLGNAKVLEESARSKETEAIKRLSAIEARSRLLDKREEDLENRELAVIVKELEHYSPVRSNNALPNSTVST